jgi:hypothetical protein
VVERKTGKDQNVESRPAPTGNTGTKGGRIPTGNTGTKNEEEMNLDRLTTDNKGTRISDSQETE